MIVVSVESSIGRVRPRTPPPLVRRSLSVVWRSINVYSVSAMVILSSGLYRTYEGWVLGTRREWGKIWALGWLRECSCSWVSRPGILAAASGSSAKKMTFRWNKSVSK